MVPAGQLSGVNSGLAALAALREESFFESVNDAGDAVFDQGNSEVDEQPQAFISQL